MGRIYRDGTDKVEWNIPSLFNNDSVAFMILDSLKELGIHSTIKGAYGSPHTIWNSGRPSKVTNFVKRKDIKEIVKLYNDFGVSCYFTFNNYNITEDDLSDNQGNVLCKAINCDGKVPNYAIVSSDLLADYIKSKYQFIRVVSSVIKPVYELQDYSDTPEYYNDLLQRFDKVVIRPEFCFKPDFLKKLDDPNRIEIIVNQACTPFCKKAKEHYDFYENYERTGNILPNNFCRELRLDIHQASNTLAMSHDEMKGLIKLGFHNFKLQGRNVPEIEFLNMIQSYVFEPTGIFQSISNTILRNILDGRYE